MRDIALVALGSAAGGVCRLLLGRWIAHTAGEGFPFAILTVNVAGSFLIGLAMASEHRLLLAAGFCGGFTTFSAFSLEMVEMMRRAEAGKAAIYAALSVAGCMTATWAGLRISGR